MTKLIFFAGSARKDSHTKKLARYASEIAGSISGIEATFIDLADYPMPIYNGDLEAESGLPENARKLKKIFLESDGFFIVTPEYNSSYSALLKNTLDWISRSESKDEPALAAFDGKVAAISAASPGHFGGLRALTPLRILLSNMSVLVIPNQIAVAKAHEAFDENGRLKGEDCSGRLKNVVNKLAGLSSCVSASKKQGEAA